MKWKSSGLGDRWEGPQCDHWHRRTWMKRQETERGREVGTGILMNAEAHGTPLGTQWNSVKAIESCSILKI